MSCENNVVLLWVVCLSFEVVVTGCEVVWVHRNVTDSFRVGEDGCTNNNSVCSTYAECQFDGSCSCDVNNPNFRNPVIKHVNLKIEDGDSYGCVDDSIISFRLTEGGNAQCKFRPFQIIPYSHKDPVTKFSHHSPVFNCFLQKALVKFPDNATEMELRWLNESYVDFNISNNAMYFKWRRSVPDLQGTIIRFILTCTVPGSTSPAHQTRCLRAKILGTWTAASSTTTLSPSVRTTTPVRSGYGAMRTTPTTSAGSRPPGEVSGDDGGSSGTIIIIAVVVPLILLIVVVAVLWWSCKRKNRNNLRKKSRGNSGKTNGTTSLKRLRHIDSKGLAEPDDSNHGYPTSGNHQVMVQGNPTYETSNVKNNKAKNNDQEDPGYATPDFKRKDVERVNSYPEPGYESVDLKRKEINDSPSESTHSVPEKDKEEGNRDIKRIEVNGEMYALPDKKGNGLNYMDPSKLVSGVSNKTEREKEANQPTEYAQIVGVLTPATKKKNKEN